MLNTEDMQEVRGGCSGYDCIGRYCGDLALCSGMCLPIILPCRDDQRTKDFVTDCTWVEVDAGASCAPHPEGCGPVESCDCQYKGSSYFNWDCESGAQTGWQWSYFPCAWF